MWYLQGRRVRITGKYRQHDRLRCQHHCRRDSHRLHHSKEGRGWCVSFQSIAFCNLQSTQRTPPSPGRSEFRLFLFLYLISLPFQLLTTGAVLQQGSTTLVVLTAIHAGIVAALFWTLLGNAIVSTQVVEDGTLSSLIVRLSHITPRRAIPSFCDRLNFSPQLQPLCVFTLAFLGVTTYISLDVALTITTTFGPSEPPSALHSIPLFVLTSIWPGA